MTTVNITPMTEPDELFCHYPGEHAPQESVLVLDLEDGELTARYNPQIGSSGLPEDVYNRRTLWIRIPHLTADAANSLLKDVKPIAQRILDGATIEEDRNLNSVGHLNDDAHAAYRELAEACQPHHFDDSDTVSEWDAGDWFNGEGPEEVIKRLKLTADTTDEQITAMAREEEEEARKSSSQGYVLLVGAEEYLTNLRDELRDKVREQIEETVDAIAKLETKLEGLIVRVHGYGDSYRAIGELADISHTEVGRIVNEAAAAAQEKAGPWAQLERYHLIRIDGEQFVIGYTDVTPDFRGLSLCFDGEAVDQPATVADAERYITEKAGKRVRLVRDDALSASYTQECWVPTAVD